MSAALAGVAVGGAAPFLLPDHPDAALLALCAEFETVQRTYNGLWTWRLGGGRYVEGPNYIVDDDERDEAAGVVEDRAWEISNRIFDMHAHTIDGLRAKARCLLLANVGMRHLVTDAEEDGEHRDFGFCAMTRDLLATLLIDLNDGAVTVATCMDAPGIEVAS